GPAAAVDAQKAAFLALAPTIRARGAPALLAPAGPAGPPAPPADVGAADAQPVPAPTPPAWRAETHPRQPPHHLAPQGTELYLGQLSGDLPSLITVWRGQMGLDPIDEAGVAKLPRARMLGGDAVLVDLEGTLNDVTNGRTRPGCRMVLVALAQGNST